MKIRTGPWVDGDEFFGREKELDDLARVFVNKRASAFIPGPRRIGKTSLVQEFILRNKHKYNFIYFDLERRHSVIELCEDLIKEIKKKYPGLVKSIPDLKNAWNKLSEMIPSLKVSGMVDIKTGKIPTEVKETLDRMEELFEELYKQNFIFVFDEFADFLLDLKQKGIEEVRFFLSWLRGLRQEEKIRLIITGSINIISAIEELNVPDMINDLSDIEIFPLEEDEIRTLLKKLTEDINVTLEEDAIAFAVYRLSDGIPFFIQLFASGLRSYKDAGKKAYDAAAIKEIYFKITGKQHKEFIDLHSRLKEYLSESQFKVAKKILAHLASDAMSFDDLWPYVKDIVVEKEVFRFLLKRLVDECYIKEEKRLYRFVSPMLADWWNNTYDWEKE